MGDASMVRLQRKSSIETEPRTLNVDQIHFAREAALCVLNTMNIEDALRIFTEGLKPVVVVDVARQDGESLREIISDKEEVRFISERKVVTAPF